MALVGATPDAASRDPGFSLEGIMSQQFLTAVIAVVFASCGAHHSAVAAQTVDLELALAVDVSSSIDAEEARLQRNGLPYR